MLDEQLYNMQKFLFVTRNIALYRREEAQIYFYFGIRSLIIFMKAAGFGFYALYIHHFVLSSTLLQRRPSATVFVSVFYLTVCSLMPVVCWWCLMPGHYAWEVEALLDLRYRCFDLSLVKQSRDESLYSTRGHEVKDYIFIHNI